MKRFMVGFLATMAAWAFVIASPPANGQVVSVPVGATLSVQAAHFCEDAQSAQEVAAMDAGQGIQMAKLFLASKQECGTGDGVVKVKKSLYKTKTPRGTTLHVLEVESVINKHTITIYMLFEGDIVETRA